MNELNIPKGSSEEDIKAAFKQHAQKWHPDKHQSHECAEHKRNDA